MRKPCAYISFRDGKIIKNPKEEGKMVWNAKIQGPYRKSDHGPLGEETHQALKNKIEEIKKDGEKNGQDTTGLNFKLDREVPKEDQGIDEVQLCEMAEPGSDKL